MATNWRDRAKRGLEKKTAVSGGIPATTGGKKQNWKERAERGLISRGYEISDSGSTSSLQPSEPAKKPAFDILLGIEPKKTENTETAGPTADENNGETDNAGEDSAEETTHES